MVNERVEQMKRQQFISLDSQFINVKRSLPVSHLERTSSLIFQMIESQSKITYVMNDFLTDWRSHKN